MRQSLPSRKWTILFQRFLHCEPTVGEKEEAVPSRCATRERVGGGRESATQTGGKRRIVGACAQVSAMVGRIHTVDDGYGLQESFCILNGSCDIIAKRVSNKMEADAVLLETVRKAGER